MTAWEYDPVIDAAAIHIAPRDMIPPAARTIDLEDIHVLIDVDVNGNVLTIELLGDTTRRTILRDLGRFLRQEANSDRTNDDDHS